MSHASGIKTMIPNIFKRRKKNENLELAMTYWGHKFYVFKDVNRIPAERIEALYYRLEEVKLGVTKADILAFLDIMKNMITSDYYGNQIKISTLVDHFEGVVNQDFNMKPVLHLATAVVLVNDEPEGRFTEKHQLLKFELIEKSDKVLIS